MGDEGVTRFRTFKAPPEWDDAALDRERLKAIDLFIAERKAYLRVVTLADMVTVHNAFFDRNYKG